MKSTNWNDKSEVLAAVKNYGSALEYASEELQADKEVVLEAVKNYGSAPEYASEELRGDKEVVLAVAKRLLEVGNQEVGEDAEFLIFILQALVNLIEAK